MFIDHLGFLFFPEILYFRIIGRTAFVLYSFLVVEGVIHTSNIHNYLKKILLWGVLSEVPFDLVFHGNYFCEKSQNVFFTLFIGALGIEFVRRNKKQFLKQGISVAIGMGLGYFLKVDYSWYGIGLIYCFYFFRQHNVFKFLYAQILSAVFAVIYTMQFFAFTGFAPIYLYNGKLGYKTGNIYYSFYALHLSILYLISILNN